MRTNITHGWKRLFAITAVLHLLLSMVLLIVSIGGAVAAHEGEPAAEDAVVTMFADVLLAPILLARALLPKAIAPGFSPHALLFNSLAWAAAVVGIVVCWRMWRGRNKP